MRSSVRTFLFVAGTAVVLVGAFVVYWAFQPVAAPSRVVTPVAPPTHPDGIDRITPIGQGQDASVLMFDKDTGRLTSEFAAAEFEPVEEDKFRVVKPEAIFYLKDAQRIRIRGDEGIVWHSNSTGSAQSVSKNGIDLGPRRPPSRGALKNVVIDLFRGDGKLDAMTPELTVTLDNASFDNETYRIYTNDAEIGGQFVAADQVPVKGRGEDYEFDGRGLVIQWNEADRRLNLLRIAQGDRLVIKHPGRLGINKRSARAMNHQSWANMLASTDPADAAQVLPTQPAKRLTTYRATFERDVRIMQNDKAIALADHMEIDLSVGDDALRSEKGEQPALETPATAPVEPQPPAAAARPAAIVKNQDSTRAVPTEAVDRADAPIVVLWQGPLVVTPAPDSAKAPPIDEAILRLTGNPVKVSYDQNEADAGVIIYETDRQGIQMEAAPGQSVILRGQQSVVHTAYVRGALDDAIVVLGPGDADMPVEDSPPDRATARWSDSCTLHLAEQSGGEMSLDSVELAGVVQVQHPSLRLDAQKRVALALLPERDSELPLRDMQADGAVVCIIRDEDNSHRIEAESLSLETAVDSAGKRYPRLLTANENVVIADADQTVKTHALVARLNPPKRDQASHGSADKLTAEGISVDQIDATGGVHYSTPDGKFAIADALRITEDNDGSHLELTGVPSASVGADGSTLSGQTIVLHRERQAVVVDGTGSLETVKVEADGTSRPITVEWQKDMRFDGIANQVHANGDVVVLTTEPDGTVHTMTGGRFVAELVDKPGDETSQNESDDELTSRMSRKGIRKAVFADDVEIRSILSGEGDALLRRLHANTASLEYDAGTGRLTVPGNGRLLYEDHREQPAGKASGDDRRLQDSESIQGTVAMQWLGNAGYTPASGQIEFNKNVTVVFKPDKDEKQVFRIDAPRLVVEMTPRSVEASKDKKAEKPQLLRMFAENARFAATDIELQANMLVFDDARGVVIASGSRDAPVEIFRGNRTGSVGSVTYDIKNDRILEITELRGR